MNIQEIATYLQNAIDTGKCDPKSELIITTEKEKGICAAVHIFPNGDVAAMTPGLWNFLQNADKSELEKLQDNMEILVKAKIIKKHWNKHTMAFDYEMDEGVRKFLDAGGSPEDLVKNLPLT